MIHIIICLSVQFYVVMATHETGAFIHVYDGSGSEEDACTHFLMHVNCIT